MDRVVPRVLAGAARLGPVALCGCWSLFDGTFPSEAGAAASAGSLDGPSTLASDADFEDSRAEAGPDSSSCIPVASGLVGHWTMDEASILGTRLLDSSGNNSDGTLVGFTPPETAPGRFGDALVYPSTGMAYVHVPVLALDPTPGAMNSVSMWFYRSGDNIDDVLALLPNAPRYDLWLTGGIGNYLCINTGHGECVGVEDGSLRDRWVHVVAIVPNGPIGQGTLFIDGQNRNAACLADGGFASCDVTGAAGAPVDFGGETDFFFHGMLDEVRIYSRALAPAEVTALYGGTACP
jgi:concanavalin A-like lectin/glucanase superfamily protein